MAVFGSMALAYQCKFFLPIMAVIISTRSGLPVKKNNWANNGCHMRKQLPWKLFMCLRLHFFLENSRLAKKNVWLRACHGPHNNQHMASSIIYIVGVLHTTQVASLSILLPEAEDLNYKTCIV